MKKRISFGAVFVVIAILFFLLASKGNKSAGMTLAAVGFTNKASGNAEALFLVRNMTGDVSWNIYALHHKTDGGWTSVPTPMVWSSKAAATATSLEFLYPLPLTHGVSYCIARNGVTARAGCWIAAKSCMKNTSRAR